MISDSHDSIPWISLEKVQEIFEEFKSTRVLVLGDVMLDVYLNGSVDRISPEAPVPVMRVSSERVMLGGAANVAGNISALGGLPVLVGVIGEDEAGMELRKKLNEMGPGADGLVVDNSRPTTRKTRVLASKQQVVRVDREASHDIDGHVVDELLRVVEKEIVSSDALLLQDYNKGVLPQNVIKSVISMAKEAGKIIAVDPKFHNFFEYQGVTLFKPNIREMEYAFGSIDADSRNLEKMMVGMKERLDSEIVLLTCGEEGMSFIDEEGKFIRIPAISREVYDVSGAGDTVISTVTLALASGRKILESSIIANYAASVEIQRSGVSTVSQEEVIRAMQRHGALYER